MMEKKGILTKVLALVGTVLAWFPILATIVTSIGGSLASGQFRFDYLMPAELFFAVLAGGGLLLWAAWRARLHQKLIGWGLGVAVGLLVSSQALAVVTGLASGRTEPTGLAWALVLTALGLYVLAVIVIGVGGILLIRDLFNPPSG